jgi:hypothetical protein
MMMIAMRAFPLIESGILLGDQGRYVHMGRRFQPGGSAFESEDLLILCAVLGVVVAVVWLATRFFALRQKRAHHSPRRLFGQLCRAHGLAWTDRQLLRQMARRHRLTSPCLMFLDVSRFDMQQLGPAFAGRASQIAALRQRLFTTA